MMQRILLNRYVMLGLCLLFLGLLYASLTDSFHASTAYAPPAKTAAQKAQDRREQADDDMARWQDESQLVDTGEGAGQGQNAAPAPLPQAQQPAPPPPAYGEEGGQDAVEN